MTILVSEKGENFTINYDNKVSHDSAVICANGKTIDIKLSEMDNFINKLQIFKSRVKKDIKITSLEGSDKGVFN